MSQMSSAHFFHSFLTTVQDPFHTRTKRSTSRMPSHLLPSYDLGPFAPRASPRLVPVGFVFDPPPRLDSDHVRPWLLPTVRWDIVRMDPSFSKPSDTSSTSGGEAFEPIDHVGLFHHPSSPPPPPEPLEGIGPGRPLVLSHTHVGGGGGVRDTPPSERHTEGG